MFRLSPRGWLHLHSHHSYQIQNRNCLRAMESVPKVRISETASFFPDSSQLYSQTLNPVCSDMHCCTYVQFGSEPDATYFGAPATAKTVQTKQKTWRLM